MKKPYLKRIYLIIISLLVCFSGPAGAGHLWPTLPQALAKKEAYNLSESKLFSRTLAYIQKNYVEPDRINPKEMFKGSLDELQKNVPEILVIAGSPTSFTITIDKATKKFSSPLKNLDDFWELMKEILVFIELNYKGEIELKDIESIVINGALNTLDPHSAFLTPEFYKEFKIDTGGQFGGLGIVITSKDGQLTVIAPIEDTPAWKAGIKSGDVITEIDHESTINMSLMKAVEKLRGKIGTRVTIMVERKGRPAPLELILTRARIHIESIKSALIKDAGGSVGYIKVKRFQKETEKDFFTGLKKMQTEAGPSFKGLILDLRNNPGGLLNQAVTIADTFLTQGTIVSTVGANKKFIDEDVAHLKGTEPNNYPLIVLVNEGSASASEIVAGALQAYRRALVIGQKTFGKGSVQSVYELGNNYALKLTIAQYLTAGKNSIQTVGITPDITLMPVTIDKEYVDIAPNKPSSEKELEKHLEQIKPTAGKEKAQISFYKPYIDEEDFEEVRRREYSGRLEFKDDFAVKLATKIILSAQSAKPELMLKESDKVIVKLEQQEEEKISARLQELGTNWGRGQDTSPAKISATFSVVQKGKPVTRATAGEDTDITLTLTNLGEKTIYKVMGIIESDNPLLDEKEFVLGQIKPGQSASRKVHLKLSNSINDRNIPFKVSFKQGDKSIPHQFSSALKVSGLAKPKFSFNYQLEEPRTVGATNPLPRGKSVPLTVKVKNIGSGPTKEASAYISNKKVDPGVFIEQGRVNLGVIKPGEAKKATFAFRVQPVMTSSSFLLELTVNDRELFEFLSADLEITLESGTISPPAGIWYEGPRIELAENAFPIVTKGDKYTLKGKLVDDSAIKDYYIFVDEEKVVYRSNPHETNTMDIDATFKIKQGNNDVTIIARDNNNLAAKESFVIQRGTF